MLVIRSTSSRWHSVESAVDKRRDAGKKFRRDSSTGTMYTFNLPKSVQLGVSAVMVSTKEREFFGFFFYHRD